MLPRSISREHGTASPGPVYMSQKQMGDYLTDLRAQRLSRPAGSRPYPPSNRNSAVVIIDNTSDAAPKLSFNSDHYLRRAKSRDFSPQSRRTSGTLHAVDEPKSTYIEREQRWQERQEAHAMRLALQSIDNGDDAEILASAKAQAAELIHRHQRPDEAYRLDENAAGGKYGVLGHEMQMQMQQKSDSRQSSGSSYRSDKEPQYESAAGQNAHRRFSGGLFRRYSLASLSSRRRSSGNLRKASGEDHAGAFTNPGDKIFEDVEEIKEEEVQPRIVEAPVPSHARRNPFARLRPSRQSLLKKDVESISAGGKSAGGDGSVETDKDETRYKNGVEVRSDDIRAATSMKLKDRSSKLPSPTGVTNSPNRPIVSFDADWKATEATNKQSDMEMAQPRSEEPQRPMPTVPPTRTVLARSAPSDAAQPWKRVKGADDSATPAHQAAAPIPSIVMPDAPSIAINNIPSIQVPDVPSIHVAETPSISINSPPTISINAQPPPMQTMPRSPNTQPASAPHWTPSTHRPTAQCAHCALPISGRIVTAASTRFHPECFTCYKCNEGLECVAFYPEPDAQRAQRLTHPSHAEDSDTAPRFYCHLDFHELFSPRCKNCKTPIEGEIVVACGAEWHVGHFFCAQCGDPFDAETPFVESDGYAWCVPCHTKRYSPKCRQCRRPVTDVVVSALGAEWHAECFCCAECGAAFDDGRFFVREDGLGKPVCVACEERRLKA